VRRCGGGIRAAAVVVVEGETGCGKTTQVPQFLVDHCWAQSKPCRVMCTQPRVISARTVAERVAAERGERQPGQTVGYQARSETVVRPYSRCKSSPCGSARACSDTASRSHSQPCIVSTS
jgi:HrpA-like RNA helicase